jgi:CubicO group peptidase (beta-lactamase class C family)
MRIAAALALLVCVACGTPSRGAESPTGELTAPGPAAASAASDSAFVAALRARLAAATAAGEFSGAVLVARDGRTLFEGAYGLADRERRVPNTPLTQFRVGSMYKMLTAVARCSSCRPGRCASTRRSAPTSRTTRTRRWRRR